MPKHVEQQSRGLVYLVITYSLVLRMLKHVECQDLTLRLSDLKGFGLSSYTVPLS
jgi:hypothetical protein